MAASSNGSQSILDALLTGRFLDDLVFPAKIHQNSTDSFRELLEAAAVGFSNPIPGDLDDLIKCLEFNKNLTARLTQMAILKIKTKLALVVMLCADDVAPGKFRSRTLRQYMLDTEKFTKKKDTLKQLLGVTELPDDMESIWLEFILPGVTPNEEPQAHDDIYRRQATHTAIGRMGSDQEVVSAHTRPRSLHECICSEEFLENLLSPVPLHRVDTNSLQTSMCSLIDNCYHPCTDANLKRVLSHCPHEISSEILREISIKLVLTIGLWKDSIVNAKYNSKQLRAHVQNTYCNNDAIIFQGLFNELRIDLTDYTPSNLSYKLKALVDLITPDEHIISSDQHTIARLCRDVDRLQLPRIINTSTQERLTISNPLPTETLFEKFKFEEMRFLPNEAQQRIETALEELCQKRDKMRPTVPEKYIQPVLMEFFSTVAKGKNLGFSPRIQDTHEGSPLGNSFKADATIFVTHGDVARLQNPVLPLVATFIEIKTDLTKKMGHSKAIHQIVQRSRSVLASQRGRKYVCGIAMDLYRYIFVIVTPSEVEISVIKSWGEKGRNPLYNFLHDPIKYCGWRPFLVNPPSLPPNINLIGLMTTIYINDDVSISNSGSRLRTSIFECKVSRNGEADIPGVVKVVSKTNDEAEILKTLQVEPCRHIPTVISSNESYLAMTPKGELLEKDCPTVSVLLTFIGVLHAMEHAYNKHYLHRDISHANIVVVPNPINNEDEYGVLIDWHIACPQTEPAVEVPASGTEYFMAPDVHFKYWRSEAVKHQLGHDLESLFLVLMYQTFQHRILYKPDSFDIVLAFKLSILRSNNFLETCAVIYQHEKALIPVLQNWQDILNSISTDIQKLKEMRHVLEDSLASVRHK